MSGLNAKNKLRIFKIQKKALRIITNSAYNAHTTPLFLHHKILPYDLLIQQAQLTFMHSIEYQYAPQSFGNVWKKNRDRDPNINLRNADDYFIPVPRTESFKKNTYYALPAIWNSLTPNIKLQHNKTTFKWALKAHLLDNLSENNE
jgi:hypothetical protein